MPAYVSGSGAFQQLFEHGLDGIVITDENGVVVDVNRAYERLTGYSRDEWLGHRPNMIGSGKTRPEVFQEMWSALGSKGQWIGEVINRRPDGTRWISFLSITRISYADGRPQGYVGISRDLSEQYYRERELRERLHEISNTQEAAVLAMAMLAELHDPGITGHLDRIRAYTEVLYDACAAGPSGKELPDRKSVLRGSVLHDVGKIAVPEAILQKRGPLSPEEFIRVKEHALVGAGMLGQVDGHLSERLDRPASFLSVAVSVARSHHEWWNGRGYPDGLAGKAIPLPARLVALVDVYDALTSVRPYKGAWSHAEARAYLVAHAGSQFDPAVVKAFLQVEEPFRRIHNTRAGVAPTLAPSRGAGRIGRQGPPDDGQIGRSL